MNSFGAFCRQYLPVVERYLIGLAPDSGWAPPIARDCLLAAGGRWDDLLAGGQPERWLFEAATRELRRFEARATGGGRARPRAGGLAVSDLLIAANSDSWVCDHIDVIAALRSLPRRQAEAVGLHYLLSYSIAEVAGLLGVGFGTAQAQLDHGIAALAQRDDQGQAAGAGSGPVTPDDLLAAGATIGLMPAADLNRRLRRLKQPERGLAGRPPRQRDAACGPGDLESAVRVAGCSRGGLAQVMVPAVHRAARTAPGAAGDHQPRRPVRRSGACLAGRG